jgi:hypothetical protein
MGVGRLEFDPEKPIGQADVLADGIERNRPGFRVLYEQTVDGRGLRGTDLAGF